MIPYLVVLLCSCILFKIKSAAIPYGIFLFVILLPATLVAVLRGNIGTDTINYLGYFDDLRNGTSENSVYEPGFKLISETLNILRLSARTNLAIISAIIVILLCASFSKSKNQVILFCWIVFPLYFVDMTMNGVRYGLAFSFGCLAVDAIKDKRYFKILCFTVMAISIQYSSALIIIPFLFLGLNKKLVIYLLGGTIIIILIFVGYAPMQLTYLYDKQDAYKDIVSPGAASGLIPLLIFTIIYVSFIWTSQKNRYSQTVHLLLFCQLASFAVAKFSYAGLRLQMLFLFALLIFIKGNFPIIKAHKIFNYSLFVVGILSFIVLLKNISAKVEDVQSPLIPYKFFWQKR